MNIKSKLALMVITSSTCLLGCGDDSNREGSSSVSGSSSSTITVIDGYLGYAEVYSDSNEDGIPDDTEYVGTTNIDGEIDLSSGERAYPIIAKAIADITEDSDTGIVTQSYEMIASTGATVISPYTTLAYLYDVSMDSLIEDYLDSDQTLGLSASELSGDFMSLSSEQGQITQLLARSIRASLQSTIVDNLNSELMTDTGIISNQLIDIMDDDEYNFDSIIIEVNDSAEAEINYIENRLGSYLNSNTFYLNGLEDWQQEVTQAYFLNTNLLANGQYWLSDDYLNDTSSEYAFYSVERYQLDLMDELEGDSETTYDFSFLTDALSIALSESELSIWLATDYYQQLQEGTFVAEQFDDDDFKGEDWYMLSADGDNGLTIIEYNFSSSGTFRISSDAGNSGGNWELQEDQTDSSDEISNSYSQLTLVYDDSPYTDNFILLLDETDQTRVLALFDSSDRDTLHLLFKDEDLAEQIYEDWEDAQP